MIDNATEILAGRGIAVERTLAGTRIHWTGDDSLPDIYMGYFKVVPDPVGNTPRIAIIDGHHPVSAADTYPAGYAVVNETRLTLDAAWFAVTAALSYVCVDFTAVNGGDASYEYQLLAEYPEPVENHAFRLLATVHFANGRTIIRQQHHGVLYANIFRYCSNEV